MNLKNTGQMDRGNENPTQHLPWWLRKTTKNVSGWSAPGFEPETSRMRVSCVTTEPPRSILLVLFLPFRRKTRLIKWASVCVCVCLCKVLVPSYPIDPKFRLHIVSYRNSPTALIPFLIFKIVPRRNFLSTFFLHLINRGKFPNS